MSPAGRKPTASSFPVKVYMCVACPRYQDMPTCNGMPKKKGHVARSFFTTTFNILRREEKVTTHLERRLVIIFLGFTCILYIWDVHVAV